MKFSTKVLTFLFFSHLTITILISLLSLYNLNKSQEENINIFKDKLIEENFDSIESNFKMLMAIFEQKYDLNNVSISEILKLINKIDPNGFNIIIIDLKDFNKFKYFTRYEFLKLLNKETLEKFQQEMFLTSINNFTIDNYKDFISSEIGTVTPVRIHFKILEKQNIILGYGKVLEISKIRLKYIKDQSKKKNFQMITISIIVFIMITIITFVLVVLYMERSLINPINKLNTGLKLVREGKLNTYIKIENNRGEINNLAISFNNMITDLNDTRSELNANINKLKKEINIRKKIEVELLRSRERFRSLVETSNDWIWEIDRDCYYLYTSPGVKDLLGYEIEDLIGKTPFAFMSEDEAVLISKIFKKLMKSGKPVFGLESVNIHKDGHEVILETNGVPVYNDKYEVIGYRGINRDITKRKQTEIELSRSKEKLKERIKELNDSHKEKKILNDELFEKNKELERVIYVTSHDLRSPLVNINGFSRELEFALNNLSDILSVVKVDNDVKEKIIKLIEDEIPESLNYIKKSIIKMDQLLNGLLQLSRIGRNAVTFYDIDMNELISDVIHNFDYEIKNRKINVKVGDLPLCKGEPMQINQLFSNLVDNAIKYLNPEKKGEIKITGVKKKKEIIYCVEDNGVGIPKESKEKIFDLFQRLNPENIVGDGIGLNIVKKIVGIHKGEIRVESERDKGAKFYVSLPVTKK